MVKKIFPVIIVLFFSLFSAFSLLHKGLPPTHDGEYHVIRFYEFDKVIRDGNMYPRWAPDLNNGYGVPLFNYVYPFPNYVSSSLHLLGFSFIDTFKLNMFLATLLGSFFFYLFAKDYWGNLGGIVSSVFYSFSPYRFVDIYIRGSVGEVWALAFFPMFLWSITKFLKNGQKKFLVPSSIFLALIIFSHNILALMFFIFTLYYISLLILNSKNKKNLLLQSFLIIGISLGLSSIFWLPALLEKGYTTGLQIYNVAENFPDLYQLIIPSWGSGFSGDMETQMSFQIGLGNLLAFLLSLVFIPLFVKRKSKNIHVILFFLLWFVAITFLMLKISLPIWNALPLMDYFQFPWRFLSLEILIASFLAGSIFSILFNKYIKTIFAVIMIILVFSLGINYAKPPFYHYRNDNYYLTRSNFIDGTNSPGDLFNTIWINKIPSKTNIKIKSENEIKQINLIEKKSTEYKFEIIAKKEVPVIANIAYFPGWSVRIDEKETEIKASKDGLLSFIFPKGKHSVEITFKDTVIRKISAILFFLSLIFIVILSKKAYYDRISKK